MIPSVIASQVERGIKDFLKTTFPPSTPFFKGILDRLFEERDSLFKCQKRGPIFILSIDWGLPLDFAVTRERMPQSFTD